MRPKLLTRSPTGRSKRQPMSAAITFWTLSASRTLRAASAASMMRFALFTCSSSQYLTSKIRELVAAVNDLGRDQTPLAPARHVALRIRRRHRLAPVWPRLLERIDKLHARRLLGDSPEHVLEAPVVRRCMLVQVGEEYARHLTGMRLL